MGMKWTIGLDLRANGQGALAFARWIGEQTETPERERFDAIHVLEASYLLQELRSAHLPDLEAHAQQRCAEVLAEAGLREPMARAIVIEGDQAETSLAHAASTAGAEALILGRRVGAHDEGIVRLGRVARRAVRWLPLPTIIVPGDLGPTEFGSGPVILATDLTKSSSAAARFAQSFANVVRRKIVVVHVVPRVDPGSMFVPSATVEQLFHQLGLRHGVELEQWRTANGLGDCATVLATGDVISRLIGIAEQERAPLVVCGSRMLSLADRIFTASVGSTLAAYGSVPVAIVPPEV